MLLLFKRRETLAIGIVAILLLAVVAPLCFMPASPATAMQPAPVSPSAPSGDCGEEAGPGIGSMAECPYMRDGDVPAAIPSTTERTTSLAALPALPVGPPTAGAKGKVTVEQVCVLHAPPPLTPLRV